MKGLAIAGLLLSALSIPAQAQIDSVLIGITAVNAIVRVSWDEGLNGNGTQSESRTRQIIGDRFTLELRKLGAVVNSTAKNYLSCNVVLVSSGGMFAYGWSVDYEEWVSVRGQRQWATLWSRDGVGMGGNSNATSAFDDIGKRCAERFGNAWLAANPRRR